LTISDGNIPHSARQQDSVDRVPSGSIFGPYSGVPMKNKLENLKLPVLLSTILVLSFMLLEWINRRNLQEDMPLPLFGILWLLATVFFSILVPNMRNTKAGKNLTAHPFVLLASAACLVFIAALWGAILLDQMPCFLGVPNCD
jgi:hypothetical protein